MSIAPQRLLGLQQTAENAAVSRVMTVGLLVVQRLSGWHTERKRWIESALAAAKWDDAETPGAYYIFNGLSTQDMIAVYNGLSAVGKKALEANLDKADLDCARMYQAIVQAKSGSSWWQEKSGRVHWVIRSVTSSATRMALSGSSTRSAPPTSRRS